MAVKNSAYSTSHDGVKKGTSIGKRPKSMSTMNKSKKRGFKSIADKVNNMWDWLQNFLDRIGQASILLIIVIGLAMWLAISIVAFIEFVI
jgi:hypothetical protein